MTAAAMAPIPIIETAGGHRCCSTMGNMNDHWLNVSGTSPSNSVWFQSEITVFQCVFRLGVGEIRYFCRIETYQEQTVP